jgi:acetyl-CoA C-acetyltransferase
MKPSVRVEAACASGSAAVHLATRLIDAMASRVVLVVGVEKMTTADPETVRQALLSASYYETEGSGEASFAGHFARMAQAYFAAYGDHSGTLARIAAKNHAYGARNPLAHMQKDLGFEFCNTVSERNPIVAAPLRRTDCSMVSDGAAALVLTAPGVAGRHGADIAIRAHSAVTIGMPMDGRDLTRLDGCAAAWQAALQAGRIDLDDLDFVETHDCFTIAELMQYEAMGLAPPGRGAEVLANGDCYLGGRLPVNLSGGLKAKGHPVGATGVSMHVLAARQLAGDPAGAGLPGARLGGVFNMGGTAVANHCSILERLA